MDSSWIILKNDNIFYFLVISKLADIPWTSGETTGWVMNPDSSLSSTL